MTAQARRDMGQAVHILDPMGEGGAGFNPLQALDPEARDYVEQIDAIVDALVIGGDAQKYVLGRIRPHADRGADRLRRAVRQPQ